jgi:beta-lactamase regulating signal transducer with metallopeptidase domain
MISVLIDAALRSLFVGLIVAVGLRAFRIRNVFAQKAALGLVLVGALAMPLLMPIMDRSGILPASASIVLPVRPMTLLEELQAKLLAKSGSRNVVKPAETPVPATDPAQAEKPSSPSPDRASAPRAKESSSTRAVAAQSQAGIGSSRAAKEMQPFSRPRRVAFSLAFLALSMYLGIAALLLLRLAFGLIATVRLWFNAVPVSPENLSETPTWLRVRASDSVPSPLTVGSAVLLPADFETWDKEKFRIVLAHERSHVRQGDFYLQLLAGLYAALVWISPLGWWLKKELADLSEAISDRAGIEEARSRASYAQILLEFAVAPRPTALGVAMARPGSLTRRIERLLNEQTFRQSFAGGRNRALFAVVLVPLALFAGTALVRVQAATQSTRVAWIAPAASTAVSPALEPEMAYPAEQFAPESVEAGNLAIGTTPDVSASAATTPETEAPAIATSEVAAGQAAPNLFQVPAVPRAVAAQLESGNTLSFDRTLAVSGEAQLIVSTGSGNIHLTRGSGNQIHIHGQIHLSHEGSEGQAREIAANPPIEQTGDVIRVGQQHEQHWHGISINYQIEAPAGTVLEARSGSGDIVDEGVGKNAKLETGSGNINANGLQGAFVVKTGSGDITAEQTGQGDVKAETGSGNVEIKEIHGSFWGRTGSGDIKATGTPSAPWTLETGSGNVELWAGNAPLTLDASTGSGSVTTDHEMLVKGSLNHHHVTGNLNGGGPLVHVQTGSGDVHVH